jgi:hypothetical protein
MGIQNVYLLLALVIPACLPCQNEVKTGPESDLKVV